MNYKLPESATDESVLELQEPTMIAYRAGNVIAPGSSGAVIEDMDSFDFVDGAGLEGEILTDMIGQIFESPDPKYSEARAEFERMFAEAAADRKAKRWTSHDEFMREFWREVENEDV
ncbi:MAG: hypothetical protein LBC70_05400 [Chitinispirillales bacterium]|jgi:hypothetical protein|nr:hypothetical protein [Chitinispirillales bacterium]